MALMMSLNESLFQTVPGAGILIGGAITALGSPRAALAVAAAGSLGITAAAWLLLPARDLRRGVPGEDPSGHEDARQAATADGSGHGDATRRQPPGTPSRSGDARHEPSPAPAVRHQ